MNHMLAPTRAARVRVLLPAVLAALVLACEAGDPFTGVSDAASSPVSVGDFARPSFSSGFRGGIPFGVYHLPKQAYGSTFNGTLGNLTPGYVGSYLEAARLKGTKLILSFVGNEKFYRNDDHSFSLAKWKQRLDPYKGIDLAPYVKDGTLIGHYLIDEPQDKSNWGGGTISPATLDEMAAYSKQLWPTVPTIVRTWPSYLKGRKYQHLDAAWAQYSAEGGASSQRLPIAEFMAKNVSEARESGLALVVGINLLAGGTSQGGLKGYYSDRNAAGAAELEQWGKVMLANPYPCAFIGWKYHEDYLGRSDISAAMRRLSDVARVHPGPSCSAKPVSLPSRNPINLKVTGRTQNNRNYVTLTWSGASGAMVKVYRNATTSKMTENDGKYVNTLRRRGRITYVYRVCQTTGSRCSRDVSITLP